MVPHLPYDILELIAGYTDIDSRRAMGFPPRRIAQDTLQHMNDLIERKYSSQYVGYNGQITTFLVTGKTDRITSGMYLRYSYDSDYLTIIHTNGLLDVRNDIVNIHTIGFNTNDIVRSICYGIRNAFDSDPMLNFRKSWHRCESHKTKLGNSSSQAFPLIATLSIKNIRNELLKCLLI